MSNKSKDKKHSGVETQRRIDQVAREGAKGAKKATKKYERPTPKVSRLKRGTVLSVAEREAFLASRPDLKKPG